MVTRLAFIFLCLPGAVRAGPPPSPAVLVDGQQDEGQPDVAFAHQLHAVCTQIAAQYVRPVSRIDLVERALLTLAAEAHRPAPPHLRDRLSAARREEELIALILRCRQEIGDVPELHGRNGLVIACQGLTPLLDPYSMVVTGEEQRRTLGLEQEGIGLGLEVNEHFGCGSLVVKTVPLGGPAQRHGLRPGDRITHLDGRPVQTLSDEDVIIRLTQGPVPPETLERGLVVAPPAPVAVTFERPGKTGSTTLTLTPDRYRVENVLGCRREDDNSWSYWLDAHRKIAYLRLANLGRGCSAELSEVLDRLHDQDLAGLILDLRWCPGGYLDEAVDVARLFLTDGLIATIKTRNPKDQVYSCMRPGPYVDFPLVVLVNGETAGGAELIPAALQDHHRARVAGQRTLGKASVQTPIHFSIGLVGMKLTSGTFVRPGGKNLHRFTDSKDADDWGVKPEPDLDSRLSPALGKTLKRWYLLYALRPGEATERLPLDDPASDPQRQAALEAMQEMIQQKTVQASSPTR
jgi:carboxyl-terminal processing protease